MAHTTSTTMIRTVALLALVACASTRKPWDSGFLQTLGSFTELPRTLEKALNKNWVEVQGPTTSTGYDQLTMVIKPTDCTTGLLFDGNNLAGYMVALAANTTTLCYDATEQGLIPWTCSADGALYYASLFFVVPEDNSTSTVYDESKVCQGNNLTFLSTYGEKDYMPTNLTDIKNNDTSVWYKQACVLWMGLHYYRNMTTSTTCDKPFPPYFGLYDDHTNQLIGAGFMVMGKCVGDSYEHPSTSAVKMIVKNGPQCLYDMVDTCGACTRHIYFVDNPRLITCLF